MASRRFFDLQRVAWLVYNLAFPGLISATVILPSASHSPFATALKNWTCPTNNVSKPTEVWPTSATTLAKTSAATINTSFGLFADTSGDSTLSTLNRKKGLPYNDAAYLDVVEGRGVSWAYNWKATPDGSLPSDMEYVPMCWGPGLEAVCSQQIQAALTSGSTHVLSFNEPDHHQQAAMTPEVAAALHLEIFDAFSMSAKIGSPSVTNGPPPMGISWLERFLDLCRDRCRIDFVTYHWYDTADNLDSLQKHTRGVIELAARYNISKVWLTEFGVNSGSSRDEATFLEQAMDFLDSTASVERYAYFMLTDGILISENKLSDLGETYTGLNRPKQL